jgi:hypothetical protein
MASADIRITLSGGEPVGGALRFDPGGTMQVAVQIVPQDTINAKQAKAVVEWHTEGRGDQDSGIALEVPLAQGSLAAGMPIQQTFNVVLPKEPWSYAGHYINIIWLLKVTIDIPFSPDINAAQPFVLAPAR